MLARNHAKEEQQDPTIERLVHNVSNGYARIFNVDVMNRILSVVYDNTSIKITNLAMFSGVNHNTCRKHVNLMSILGWVRISYDGKYTIINQTETGRAVLKSLLEYTDLA